MCLTLMIRFFKRRKIKIREDQSPLLVRKTVIREVQSLLLTKKKLKNLQSLKILL